MATPPAPFTRTGWPRLRMRLFHWLFLLKRPMTFGVRGVVFDQATNAVLLIRHTYVPGWQLPGGGVETGETAELSLIRELQEECNVTIEGAPRLVSLHFNRNASPRDHVALYLVERFTQSGSKQPDREIAEAGFFPLDGLPEETTPATRKRLAEIFDGAPPSPFW